MPRTDRKDRGLMGGVILIIVGVFLVLHQLLPDIKLWPYIVLAVGVILVIRSQLQKGSSKDSDPKPQ